MDTNHQKEPPLNNSKSNKSIQSNRPKDISDLSVLWAIRDIPRSILNASQKGILCMFLACIGNKGFCYYSIKQLQDILGIGHTQIFSKLSYLENMNFLIVKRPPKYTKGSANEYRLNYKLIMETARLYGGKV